MSRVISISNIVSKPSALARIYVWILDRLLGVAKMNRLYQQHQMQGLSKEAFADKLIDLLELDICGLEELKAKIPKSGPVVIASNHPFGGIEGVILARAIGQVRPDLKVLANKGLGIFRELKDYFIFTNPLAPKDPRNGPSLRQCIAHVKNGHALLIFPAGKVSFFAKEHGQISEHPWNKVLGKLISAENCAYIPVFISGQNSPLFYRVERVFYKMRMLLLGRELLNKTGAKININAGNAISSKHIGSGTKEFKAAYARALSYAQDSSWRYEWPADTVVRQKPLAQPVAADILKQEISLLPKEQYLTRFKGYDVYYASKHQAPMVIHEIARLRELVFRQHNEGSGEAIDTDHFDASYTHLFIVNSATSKIIGAYRMGQTDKILAQSSVEGLYLHKMFDFKESFLNRQTPCLEMGRSFLIPEYQGSYQGLLLLWRGIGAFVCKFPQYRTLYGTVSISKLYDPRSVRLIESLLIHESTHDVFPRERFHFKMHPEIEAFTNNHLHNLEQKSQALSGFLAAIEHDGKDIPVLAKQYQKMGAKFHALGIDSSFNHTPGLLLSVELSKSPKRLLKQYLGEGYEGYLRNKGE
ncbi:lysophospholipid acyltransferase family protein [Ningiella sp. W23]|uniref:lysophospholipid acyltransferase family protein n=1 Tax=Ningiella sp. W23 TaxID=3023715 RepID=UPI003757A728